MLRSARLSTNAPSQPGEHRHRQLAGVRLGDADGRRLAQIFPRARLVEIPDSYTLIPIDQPAALAREIRAELADEPASLGGRPARDLA